MKAVGISMIDFIEITTTAPASAPTTAEVIPSTNDLIDLFFAIFLK